MKPTVARRLVLLPLLAAGIVLAGCVGVTGADGWAAPVPLDEAGTGDIVIARTDDEEISAVNLATGEVLWRFPDQDGFFPGLDIEVEPDAFYGAPVPLGPDREEFLLAAYDDGIVYAVRADGSSARVIFDTDDRIIAGVLVEGRTVFIATTDHVVYAVDTDNPEQALWAFKEIGDEIWGTPALTDSDAYGRLLIVPAMDGRVYALRTEAGLTDEARLAWVFDQPAAAIASGIVVRDGRAFVGGFDGKFYAIDVETGASAWARPGRGANWFWTTALVTDGVVYAGDLSGSVWAWDAETGVAVWAEPYQAGDDVRASAVLFDDGASLVVVTRRGQVHRIDRANGLGERVSPESVIPSRVLADPLVRDGLLIVNNDKGVLFEIEIGGNIRQIYPPRTAEGA